MQPEFIAEKITQGLTAAKALHAGGHLDEARRACSLVLQLDPHNRGAKYRLGLIARQERQFDVAATHFADLLDGADDAGVAVLLAMTWREAGQQQQAIDLVARLAPRLPPNAELLVEQARSLIDLGRPAEAILILDRAIAHAPQSAVAHTVLGLARRKTGDKAGAYAAYQAALAIDPHQAVAANSAGSYLLEREDFAGAIACYRQALVKRPNFSKARKNLAYALSLNHESAAARDTFEALLKDNPDYADAHKDFGIFLLSQGDYTRGWTEYEGRWNADGGNGPDYGQGLPRWDGMPLQGRRLLLWGEQGLGDQILHGTMLRDAIAQANGPVTLAVEPRLAPLFARSFPGHEVVALGQPVAADLQVPFGSIGRWLTHRPEQRDGAYLVADAARRQMLRQRYAALAGGNKIIGLSWRSVSQHVGAYKSLDLETLLPVLRKPGVTWISLQYGDVAAELAQFAARHGVTVHQDAEIDATQDLDGLAAQIAALDGVLSASNSTVHLAGGLGQRCWVLLSAGRGRLWYWPPQEARTPWYGSLNLLWQARPGDWTSGLAAASTALDGMGPVAR